MITLCGSFVQRKIETHYRNSRFCGIYFYPLIICLLIYDHSYQNVICILSTLILTAFLNNKYYYIIRALLLIMQLYRKHPQWCIFLENQIFIPFWPIQVLVQITTIRRQNDLFQALGYLAVSRFLEIFKRKLFFKFHLSDDETKQSAHIFDQLPYELYALSQDGKVLRANHEFSEELKKKFIQCVNKKKSSFINSENKEFLVFPYVTNYKLIQSRFKCGEIDLFQNYCEEVENLYKLLCHDYQKWNNLRAFKVVKESDLNNMGQCIQDFRLLKHQLESINHLMHDQQQILMKNKKVDFFMKNYVVNLIESMITKLQDYFNVIRLDFEEGIPDSMFGDKFNILYSLYTYLLTTQLIDQKQDKLTIIVRIAQVDNDKIGYDVEFSICFNWSPKIDKFFCQNQINDQKEELYQYMIQKCKQYINIEYKQDEDDFIIFITTKMNPSSQCEDLIDNIQNVELNFTKNIIDQNYCHIIWNSKRLSSPSITYDKTLRSPQQKYTAKFNVPETTFQLISVPNSTLATPSNSNPQSLNNTLNNMNKINNLNSLNNININIDLIQEVENVIQYTIQFPQIQQDILKLFEDIIRQAYDKGLIDHDKAILDQDNINPIERINLSVCSQREQDFDQIHEQNKKIISKQFQTPQLQSRKLNKEEDRNKKQYFQNLLNQQNKYKFKQSSRKSKNQKQLSVLFSPCVMNKFRNNLVQFVQQKSKSQIPYLLESNIKFNQKIADNRCTKHNIKWTNKIKLQQLPQKIPKVLCLIPSTQYANAVKRFGNSKYGDMIVGDVLITYSVGELIQIYKQHFQQAKKSEIEELSQALLSNENQWNNETQFKQTNLIGLYNSAQLNKNLYSFLKYTIPLNQDQEQLQKSKVVIADLCK